MRTHTIGEVLNRLKDEFDDITISKIRFLEAEGLISPDRTESGYRKFTGADIDRLRYVLRAQRDRYLPLKVIKEELDRLDAGLSVAGTPGSNEVPQPPPTTPVANPAGTDTAAAVANAAGADAVPAGDRQTTPLRAAVSDVSLTPAEVADASGLTERDVAALRDHGLLGPGPTFDGDDLQAARLAAGLLELGLEARHLRMFRQFADREQALYEQLIVPLLRQRNPDSRKLAGEQAEHLMTSGGKLHQLLLARQLRTLLRS